MSKYTDITWRLKKLEENFLPNQFGQTENCRLWGKIGLTVVWLKYWLHGSLSFLRS
jgi:hypothetical protein